MPRKTEINWDWLERVNAALQAYKKRHRVTKVPQKWIGEEIQRIRGLERPVNHSVVSNWLRGREPGFIDGVALAILFEADIYALAGLQEPSAPVKKQTVEPDRRATETASTPRAAAGPSSSGAAAPRPGRGSAGRSRP